MWFGSGFNSWYVGTINSIMPLSPPASFLSWAAFEDGDADLSLDPALYGVTGGHEWALLPPAPAASQLQAAARTAAAAGTRTPVARL
jgi:hypothetical protein